MRSLALVTLILAACGGEIATVDAGGADAGGKDARSDATADGGALDCNSLRANLDALTNQARTCCPICNTAQCSHVATGLCCPVSITAGSAPELEKAVAQYTQNCGPVACPATPCFMAPSNKCVPGGSGVSQSGTCQ